MTLILTGLATLCGAVVGSFLNVVIHRVPRGESIIWPGSRCPHCQAAIRVAENIPLLSFFWLRGRCRYCQGKISFRYPLVELLTAVIFASFVWKNAASPESLIEMANQFMEQYFAKLDELSVVTFRKAKASGLATSDLREICDAASKGQIQSLLIAEDRHLWGHLDRESGRVRLLAQKLEASSDDV
ncbi:MAG: prepilin peptidase, partial [Acidobacteria bacterium]|nr:prepilin peptidase [Acidobacteriota bacterium]